MENFQECIEDVKITTVCYRRKNPKVLFNGGTEPQRGTQTFTFLAVTFKQTCII